MRIHAERARLKQARPSEYALRFAFGGACTALAGAIAMHFGPRVGGLFLAFPAIFPAGASLIEGHEKKRKRTAGFDGKSRGRALAGVDAAGAALACFALALFAAGIWKALPLHNAIAVIAGASGCWLLAAAALWWIGRSGLWRRLRRRRLRRRAAHLRDGGIDGGRSDR
jgi:hypothetical protein